METDFPMGNNPELHEELIEDFDDAAEAIMDIISSQDVIINVFN